MHHPAWASPIGRIDRDRGRNALRRIAGTLGIPEEALLREARSECYPDDAAELVRLWFKVEDPAVRRTILDQVRSISVKSR